MQDRTRDSDEDDLHDRDYDVAALANNLNQAFRYKSYGNIDTVEVYNMHKHSLGFYCLYSSGGRIMCIFSVENDRTFDLFICSFLGFVAGP